MLAQYFTFSEEDITTYEIICEKKKFHKEMIQEQKNNKVLRRLKRIKRIQERKQKRLLENRMVIIENYFQ